MAEQLKKYIPKIETLTERTALWLTPKAKLIDRAQREIQTMPIESVIEVYDQLEAAKRHWSNVAKTKRRRLAELDSLPDVGEIFVIGKEMARRSYYRALRRRDNIDDSPVYKCVTQVMEQEVKKQRRVNEISQSSNTESPYNICSTKKGIVVEFLLQEGRKPRK